MYFFLKIIKFSSFFKLTIKEINFDILHIYFYNNEFFYVNKNKLLIIRHLFINSNKRLYTINLSIKVFSQINMKIKSLEPMNVYSNHEKKITDYTSDIGSETDSGTDSVDEINSSDDNAESTEELDTSEETYNEGSSNKLECVQEKSKIFNHQYDKTDKTENLEDMLDKYSNTLSVQELNNMLIEGTIRRIVKYSKIQRISSLAVKELCKLYNDKILKLIQLLKPNNNVVKKDNLVFFPPLDKEKTKTKRYTLSDDDSDTEEKKDTIIIFCSPKRFRHIVNTNVSYRWNPSVLLYIQYYVELFIIWMIQNAEITRSLYNKKTLDSQTILYALKIVS